MNIKPNKRIYHKPILEKFLTSFLILTLSFSLCSAQNIYTTTGASANWEDESAWDCSGPDCNEFPIPTFAPDSAKIFVVHDITADAPVLELTGGTILKVSNGVTMTIEADFLVEIADSLIIENATVDMQEGILTNKGVISMVNSFFYIQGNPATNPFFEIGVCYFEDPQFSEGAGNGGNGRGGLAPSVPVNGGTFTYQATDLDAIVNSGDNFVIDNFGGDFYPEPFSSPPLGQSSELIYSDNSYNGFGKVDSIIWILVINGDTAIAVLDDLDFAPESLICPEGLPIEEDAPINDIFALNFGIIDLDRSCFEVFQGSFENEDAGIIRGSGAVKVALGDLENDGTWADSTVYHCAELGTILNIPFLEDCVTADSICACVQSGCDIVPGVFTPLKTGDIIGSELNALNDGDTNDMATEAIFRLKDDSVLIDIIVLDGKRPDVESYLLDSFSISPSQYIDNGVIDLLITCWFPIAELDRLNLQDNIINYVRPASPPISNTGLILTQGDLVQGSVFMRGGYDLSGEGIKIGVLSDSYGTNPAGLAADIANGDIPSGSDSVTVAQEFPFGQASDEGRAMLQIIHDIVPNADLFFHTGFISAGNFASGISLLDTAFDCDVIVDDITYITEPFLKDGVVSRAIDSVAANGVSYFTSAGNFGSRSYEGTLVAGDTVYDFSGTGDTLQYVSLDKGLYIIVLQWEDSYYSIGEIAAGGTQNDLDFYLVNNDGSLLYGFNRNNLGGDPIEVMYFEVKRSTSTNIRIVRGPNSTDEDIRFKYVVFRAGEQGKFDAEYLNIAPSPVSKERTSTIIGHANATGAMTVGASRYNVAPALESFSSTGGTLIQGEGSIRLKPDFSAPNGVNTSIDFGAFDPEGDGIPNFFGTSAAAPHAAGVAALLLEAKDSFEIDIMGQQPNDWVRGLLRSTASNNGVHNFDDGFGFINGFEAMKTFANPAPELFNLNLDSLPSGADPGDTTFTLIIEGAYLTNETQVFIRNDTLGPINIIDDSTATVVVPPFSGDQPFFLVNPSGALTNGTDGGVSDTIFASEAGLMRLTVIADNKTKKYGEKLPELTYTVIYSISGDTVPMSLRDSIAPAVSMSTTADNLSLIVDAGYGIFPSVSDSLLLPGVEDRYVINTQPGLMKITPLGLTITPLFRDSSITYGDSLPFIFYDYEFDADVDTALLGQTKAQHEQSLAEINAIAAISGTPLINGVRVVRGTPLINGIPLINTSFYVTKSIVDSALTSSVRGVPLINGYDQNLKWVEFGFDLFDTTGLENGNISTITNGIAAVRGTPLINGIASISGTPLINGIAGVRGTPLINGIPLINGVQVAAGTPLINGIPLINAGGNSLSEQTFLNEFDSTIVIVNTTDTSIQDTLDIFPITVITGLEADTQWVIPGGFINDQFVINYKPAPILIEKAELRVSVEDVFITEGDTIPDSFNILIEGNIPAFSDTPNVMVDIPGAGLVPGVGAYPINITLSGDSSYTTTIVPGTLYVNPPGDCDVKVEVSLDTIRVLDPPVNGYTYELSFSYTNPGTVDAYFAPMGEKNRIIPEGNAFDGVLPEVFMPDTTESFKLLFNTPNVIWELMTYGCLSMTVLDPALVPCPETLQLTDVQLFGAYSASKTIITNGSVIIFDDTELKARDFEFGPGFEVPVGFSFETINDPCQVDEP